jgi:Fe-S-cluster containining protein
MSEPVLLRPENLQSEADIEPYVAEIAGRWEAECKTTLSLLDALYGALHGLSCINPDTGDKEPALKGVACKAGCSWCCYMNVNVLPAEADLIRANMWRLSPAQQIYIRGQLKLVAELNLSNDNDTAERMRHKLPCPFLDTKQKTCTIYSMRPFACRAHHSTSLPACKHDFYDISNRALDNQVSEVVLGRAILLRAACRVLEQWTGDKTFLNEELSVGLAQRMGIVA